MIDREGRRGVGAHLDKPDTEGIKNLENITLQESPDVVAAAEPDREGRHGQRNVFAQDSHKRGGISRFPGGNITCQQG